MAWIESHEDLPNHPKTRKLARLLNIGVPQVIGHLHCLWYWTLKYADDGNLERFQDADLAEAAMWEGDSTVFIQALAEVRFLDSSPPGYAVHDWNDYAGKLVQRRKQNRDRMRAERATHVLERSRHVPPRVELPYPTVPNRTVPNPTAIPLKGDSTAPEKVVARKQRTARKTPALTSLASGTALLDLFGEEEQIAMGMKFAGVDFSWEAGKCVAWHMDRGGSGNWKLSFKNWLDKIGQEGRNDGRTPRVRDSRNDPESFKEAAALDAKHGAAVRERILRDMQVSKARLLGGDNARIGGATEGTGSPR